MKLVTYARLGVAFSIILIIFYFYSIKRIYKTEDYEQEITERHIARAKNPRPVRVGFKQSNIVVVVVACGDRLAETLNMIKSALIFSLQKINFIIFAEDNLIQNFEEVLSEWQTILVKKFTYNIMKLTFPSKDADEWRKLFKPCAAQRLFLPSVLKDVDSVLYMDTDTIFLTPVETIWSHFHSMNSSQIAALAPEHEDPNVGWYNRFAKHPFYGRLGVNSGVMLMNLTRMRAFRWGEYVVPIYKKYKLKITWGDQDIINIIFHYHPDKLYLYSCRYNYRPDHCMYMSVCKSAEKLGVAVVHGSRGFFHSQKQPTFSSIYRAIEEYQLGSDINSNFFQPLETYLEQDSETNCSLLKDLFLKNMRNYLRINR